MFLFDIAHQDAISRPYDPADKWLALGRFCRCVDAGNHNLYRFLAIWLAMVEKLQALLLQGSEYTSYLVLARL